MNRPVFAVGRRALCIGVSLAGLASASAAAAQSYGYSDRYYSGPAYSDRYESPTTAPAYSAPYYSTPGYASPTPPYAAYPPPGDEAYPDDRYAPGPRVYDDGPTVGGITVYGGGRPEVSQAVGYADLDLATDEGAAELQWRVDRAVEDVCARLGEPPEYQLQNKSIAVTCQQSARDSSFAQVRDAIASARYWARR